jgi:hypothetical protein
MSPVGDAWFLKGGGGMRKKLVVLGVVTSLIGSGVVIGAMVPAGRAWRGDLSDRLRGRHRGDGPRCFAAT